MTDDGIDLDWSPEGTPVRGDNMGLTIQDWIVRGGNLFVSATILPETTNYTTLMGYLWPMGASFAVVDRIGYSVAKLACVISRLDAGSGALPVSITATTGVSLAPGFRPRVKLGSDLRRVPIQLMFYPNASRVLATLT